jgi:HK97 family phage major capsid protein
MPLKAQDVSAWDLTRVDREMGERIDRVKAITEGFADWSQIPADREGLAELPVINQDLATLGERRDAIAATVEMQGKIAKLEDFMRTPVKGLPQPAVKARAKTFTQMFMESNLRKRALAGDRGIEEEFDRKAFFKDILGEDDALAGVDTEYPIRADRLAGIIEELFQVPNIADLIPQTTTNSNAVEYVQENYTDAAAETAEGATMPDSVVAFTLASGPVRKMSVSTQATNEVLSDEGLLRGLVQNRLRQDAFRREDLQILKGDGVAPNLEGIIGMSGVQNVNYSLAAGTIALLEAIFKASILVRKAFLNPTAAIINSNTWQTVRLERDASGGAGTGNYLLGPVADAGVPRVWGLRLVTNENMDDATPATKVPVLVGDWANSALIARNGGVTVAVSDSHGDTFLKDVLTFKATQREALLVPRPAGFCTVTVTA